MSKKEISDATIKTAFEEQMPYCKAAQKDDGSYDPFEIAEERSSENKNQEIALARAVLVQSLMATSPKERDPQLVERLAGLLVDLVTPGNLDFHVSKFVEQFMPYVAPQITVRKASKREMRHLKRRGNDISLAALTGKMLEPKRPRVEKALWCSTDKARELHILADNPETGFLNKLANKKIMVCGAAFSEGDIQPVFFGEWQENFAARCEVCAKQAPVSLAQTWNVPDKDELLVAAQTILYDWLVECLMIAKKLPETSYEKIYGHPHPEQKDLVDWNRLYDVAKSSCEMSACRAVFQWVIVAGDDCLYLPFGEKDWRALTSCLPDEVHRLVDLLDEEDLLKVLAPRYKRERLGLQDDFNLTRFLQLVLSRATGIDKSHTSIVELSNAKTSDDRLWIALDGSQKPEKRYLSILEVARNELGAGVIDKVRSSANLLRFSS